MEIITLNEISVAIYLVVYFSPLGTLANWAIYFVCVNFFLF